MKVLLVKDVYKLGHTGDVKKVADGYGRNFLLPQGLAVLATPGALKSVERIRAKAAVTRAVLNQEMSGLAEQVNGLELVFTSKAGETGKLYGSITSQMIMEAINKKLGTTFDRHQVEAEPIRTLGEHSAHVRLTIDLTPKVKVLVYREGEAPVAKEAAKAAPVVEKPAEEAPVVEKQVEETPAVAEEKAE
jgi:large subunit ribosomal protein L9